MITTSYQANKNDISLVSKGMNTGSTEMTKGIKSSHKDSSKLILLIYLQSKTQVLYKITYF